MRTMISMFVAAALLAPLPVLAQSAAPSAAAFKGVANSREVTDLIAKAKAARKEGQPTTIQRIEGLAPLVANIEYRTGVATANVHEKEGEFFIVLEGSGTLTLGGKLANEKRLNDANLSGTGIEGGTATKLAKGDVAFAPAGTPHWFNVIDGSLVLISLHFPK